MERHIRSARWSIGSEPTKKFHVSIGRHGRGRAVMKEGRGSYDTYGRTDYLDDQHMSTSADNVLAKSPNDCKAETHHCLE